MNRNPLRLQALLAALWLSIFTQQPAVTATAYDGDWYQAIVGEPTVVRNPDAPAGRRYMMFYAQSSDLYLATSEDGEHYSRIPAEQSPYGVTGLILKASDAFSTEEKVKQGAVGAPSVSFEDGQYAMSFYKIGSDSAGDVIDAAVARATSSDGIKWTVASAPQVSVQVVGTNMRADGLVERLKRLANAYSESAM